MKDYATASAECTKKIDKVRKISDSYLDLGTTEIIKHDRNRHYPYLIYIWFVASLMHKKCVDEKC
jgi:hypothetical protein